MMMMMDDDRCFCFLDTCASEGTGSPMNGQPVQRGKAAQGPLGGSGTEGKTEGRKRARMGKSGKKHGENDAYRMLNYCQMRSPKVTDTTLLGHSALRPE